MTDSLGENIELESEFVMIFKKDGYKTREDGGNEKGGTYKIFRAESSLLNEEQDMIEFDNSGTRSIITIESDKLDFQIDCLDCGSGLFIRKR